MHDYVLIAISLVVLVERCCCFYFDKDAYDATATKLVGMFNENAKQFLLDLTVYQAGMPTLVTASEQHTIFKKNS